jgi:peptidoglycan/xylan/chitin deacetylase (PgdA/CDA1 family)
MWIVLVIGVVIVALAHMAPAPFLLDLMAGERAVWHMPRSGPPTIYLTYDDGPNPTTTPALLELLARAGVHATFFIIDRHLSDETAPIIKRMFADGHSVALHSATKSDMFKSPTELRRTLQAAADRIQRLTGSRPCRAFRPRGGWRSAAMYGALRAIDFTLIGWGWMLWDVDWFHERTADRIVRRIASRVDAGDIVVMHDGDDAAPRKDQRQTVEATSRLIRELGARGFEFGTVCRNDR